MKDVFILVKSFTGKISLALILPVTLRLSSTGKN